jgi:hypothetical protein
VLGSSQLRVLPSKTAIVPVNKQLMPRCQEELERCSRTVYVANIDKAVDKDDVRNFFEQVCGECAVCTASQQRGTGCPAEHAVPATALLTHTCKQPHTHTHTHT